MNEIEEYKRKRDARVKGRMDADENNFYIKK